MSLILFWASVLFIIATYFLFPVLILVRGLVRKNPYRTADIAPNVSLIIAAYNEVASIRQRLENILELDYPRDKLQILVASDGSSDGTNEIVREFARYKVQLLALPRQGKNSALNAAVALATGDILVFSDANTTFATDAVRALVRPFADPGVGGVAGDQRYFKEKGPGGSGSGEKAYWDFDRMMKRSQSQAGNVTSATGAIYAVRRTLFRPIPIGPVDDFIVSTNVILQGYRLVFAEDAVAYESVASTSGAEFGRKVRTLVLGFRSVLIMRRLLNPLHYGFYAVQLFWHKILRRLMAVPLLVLLIATPLLWSAGLLYQVATVGQFVFYGLALLGLFLDGSRLGHVKVFSIPFYFCMVYTASLIAIFRTLRGQTIVSWETQRPDQQPVES